MLMLLQPARCREPLAAIRAHVTSCVSVDCAKMLRQQVRVRKRVAALVALVGALAVGGHRSVLGEKKVLISDIVVYFNQLKQFSGS